MQAQIGINLISGLNLQRSLFKLIVKLEWLIEVLENISWIFKI